MVSTSGAGKVNLRSFKEFVTRNFRPESPLYKVLISERDEVSPEDFAVEFGVWLKLINLSLPDYSKMVLED